MLQANQWLFRRGWLITEDVDFELSPELKGIGFQKMSWCGLNVVYQTNTLSTYTATGKRDVLLIGHAYNPFNGEIDESKIVTSLSRADRFQDDLSSLTGVFVLLVREENHTVIYQDACGMMPVYYGIVRGNKIISNYAQWIADTYNLTVTPWIKDYVSAGFYKIGIRQLPGVKSAFSELKMLTGNTCLLWESMVVSRFYPLAETALAESNEYEQIENLLVSSMSCCSRKWAGRCAVSLTGGTDSRMTLSAIKSPDSFTYFSFISNSAEEKDALTAHEICTNIGIEHTIINVPQENEEIADFESYKTVLNHNTSNVLLPSDSEIRKIVTLSSRMEGIVEVKSHISEVGRAFYYKKTGLKHFPNPLPARAMSNLSKRNMLNRRILKRMDKAFEEFSSLTSFNDIPASYDQTDMFYWENRIPMWAALAKQRFDVSHETTIIYNNRRLLELFLRFPLQERILDLPQKKIINDLNPILSEQKSNLNAMEGWKRIMMEKAFFILNRF